MINIQLDDSRRLTGKSLLWDHPGAIIDGFVQGIDKAAVVARWEDFAHRLLTAVAWPNEHCCARIFENGITVAVSAPLDALYSACELNEAAWELARADLTGQPPEESLPACVLRLRSAIDEETNPELLNLLNLAKQQGVVSLADDDEFSLGYGPTAQVWPITALPAVADIHWADYQSIPVAMVTGTNGKSTSVRILSAMIEASGRRCGVTSTDFIRVGNEIIDRGDYSGPGGARIVLRHPKTEVAILEVARGGILRRGLPLDRVDVSLVTNVAEDHLGQYGINTVEALAQTKLVVSKALAGGTLVLNADDALLVQMAEPLMVRQCWFALSEQNEVLQRHKAAGDPVCFMRAGQLVYFDGHTDQDIVAVDAIPMTLQGAAVHNISNALGAIGVAQCLGLDRVDIASALEHFASSVDDNPGRGNQFEVKGARVILDFAHNMHGIDAMANTLAKLPASRKYLMLSMAGDRSDREILAASRAAMAMQPDLLIAADLPDYYRGRKPGEVTDLIAQAARTCGMEERAIEYAADPVAGTKRIISQLQPSELALLFALSDRDDIVELLNLG
ncbi:Mur ligase family protein [Reinekea sp.]|jgi:UDP-N-acetylmuramyl tripeptide synthase|uniref:Mur ligase family protein n=1 Tax=Reinekea sp. TaxID=1970455 RepID=UPI002A82DC6A|nr:Mur ligase family protein [Reinekea sp.]